MNGRSRRLLLRGVVGSTVGIAGCLGNWSTDTSHVDHQQTAVGDIELFQTGPVVRGGVTGYIPSPSWYVVAFTDDDHLEEIQVDAEESEEDPFAAFVAATDLDSEYLVAIQSWVSSSAHSHGIDAITEPEDGHLRIEASIEHTTGETTANAEVVRTLFVRLDRQNVPAPDRITATITEPSREVRLEDRYELRMQPHEDELERPARYVAAEVVPEDVRLAVTEAVRAESSVEIADDAAAFLEPYDYLFDTADSNVFAFDVDGTELSADSATHRDLFSDRDGYITLDDLPDEIRSEVSTAIAEGAIERRRSPRIVGTAFLNGTIRDGGVDYDPIFDHAGSVPDRH